MKSNMKILITLIIFGLLLAACQPNASSPQSTAPEGEAPETSAATEKPLTKVTVQLPWIFQGEFHGIFNAIENGFYKDAGLDVEVIAGGPDVRPIQLVASGSIDFGIGQSSALIASRANGVPIVTIMQHMQDSVVVYVAKKSNGIETIQDVEGKNFGVWFTGSEYEPMLMVEKSGISKDDVNWIAQKFSMIEFYENQMEVASAAVWNELHVVFDAGYSIDDLTIFKAADYGASIVGDCLYTTEAMIQNKPEVVQAFFDATLRGWKWGLMNPEEAANIVLKYSPDLDYRQQLIQVEEVNKLLIARGGSEFGLGYTVPNDYVVAQDGLLLIQAINDPIDLDQAYTNRFWDNAPDEYKSLKDLDLSAIQTRIKDTVGDW